MHATLWCLFSCRPSKEHSSALRILMFVFLSRVLRQQPFSVILTTKLNFAVWEPWNVRYRCKCCTYTASIFFSPPGATQSIVGVYFTALYRALASSRTRLLDHIQWRATVSRTPLNEWLVRRRDLYLTTHLTTDKHPCPGWDSNPRSQQANGRRPTP